MKQVELLFPDIESLTDFLLVYKPINAEVKSAEFKITAVLSDDVIATACTRYGAVLMSSQSVA